MVRHLGLKLTILFLVAVACAPVFGVSQVIILDYHSFLGSGTSSLDFSPAEFAAQLDRFLALGYHFVPLEDALDGKVQGDNNLALTIDDGHRTDWPIFFYVLKPRNIPVTLFIPGFSVGHDRHLLTVAQVRELAAAGCTIGAHGFYHNYMTSQAFKKAPSKVIDEATRPGFSIYRMTGKYPILFAYPFGAAGPEGKSAVQKAGYAWAFAAGSKIIPVRFDDPSLDHYYVPRTIVYRWNIASIFRSLSARLPSRPSLP
jgi:peptidoglycan/xylan/chitin deacetylase (PgdA/CDA1 family)